MLPYVKKFLRDARFFLCVEGKRVVEVKSILFILFSFCYNILF